MRCLRAVLVVGITAVFVLLCRGILVLGFFFNHDRDNNTSPSSSSSSSSSAPYNKLLTRLEEREEIRISPIPEAVMIAVHIKNSGQSFSALSSSSGGKHVEDSIERLAVRRLAKDNGIEFSGAGAEEESRRTIDAHVIYENDKQTPHTRSQVESWWGGSPTKWSTQLIEASRATERAIIGEPFEVFSGIYGAAVKAKARFKSHLKFAFSSLNPFSLPSPFHSNSGAAMAGGAFAVHVA